MSWLVVHVWVMHEVSAHLWKNGNKTALCRFIIIISYAELRIHVSRILATRFLVKSYSLLPVQMKIDPP
jgi:hypothetical protein